MKLSSIFDLTYDIFTVYYFVLCFCIMVLNLESAWLPLLRHACRLVLLIPARQ